MFSLCVENLTWIKDNPDDPSDLCAHGDVTMELSGVRLKYDCTVSSGVLYMLKSLTENHILNESLQMLPCCGFMLIPNQSGTEVDIVGCSSGIDWSVIHEGENVRLILEDGTQAFVPLGQYREAVFRLADQVEEFYTRCSPKKPRREEREAYRIFWEEWHRRRGK